MADPIELDSNPNLSPIELLARYQRMNLKQVLIIGRDGDNDVFMGSNRIPKAETLWLLEIAKNGLFEGGGWDEEDD